jgi:hypothetical protein
MKKITISLFLLMCVLFSVQLSAENVGAVNAVYSNPAAFKPDQTVTFYFDLTGTGLVGRTDLHLYSWKPKEIEPWATPSPNTLLTKDPNNDALYSLTCVPTTLWSTTVADFGYQIFGLIKTEDGTKQTDDFSDANGNDFKLFDYKVLTSKIATVWPPAFVYGKPISIVVNLATAWSDGGSSQGQMIGENVYIWLGANGWSPGSQYNILGDMNARCNLVAGETNIAEYDFLPSDVFPAPAFTIKELDFLFNNGTWSKSARDVGGTDFKFKPETGVAASASFVPFPSKVTGSDLITITYDPKLDTLGTGYQQGLLTGSDKVYLYMKIETDAGVITPVEIAMVTKTDKLLMKTLVDGKFVISFILHELFTPTELPETLEVRKLECRFINFDNMVSPALTLDPHKVQVFNAD